MGNRERLLEISYEHKKSHLGSCLTALPLIEAIYDVKQPEEKFVLSAGHAGLALYVVLEQKKLLPDAAINTLGTHPDFSKSCGIDCSTGSLGQGFPIACGMALADRSKNVYCLSSDGEMAEGSMWEALRIASEQKLVNLKLVVNCNGHSAYGEVDVPKLTERIRSFGWMTILVDAKDIKWFADVLKRKWDYPLCVMALTDSDLPFAKGIDSHYCVMSKEDYERVK